MRRPTRLNELRRGMKYFTSIASALFLLITVSSHNASAGFFDKLQEAAQSAVSKSLTEKSGDLSQMQVDVEYLLNCYPKSLKPDADFEFIHLQTIWPENGGNIVYVSLKHNTEMKFIDLDGEIKMDGEALPSLGAGFYGKVVKDTKPHTITITSSRGQSLSLKVVPVDTIAIMEPANGNISLKDGFTVKLDKANNARIKCALYTKPSISQHGWGTIDYFRGKDTIFVSPLYFVSGTDWNNTYSKSYVNGKSYLLVESYRMDRSASSTAGKVKIVSRYMALSPVNVDFPTIAIMPRSAGQKQANGVTISDKGIEVFQEDNSKNNIPGYKLYKPFIVGGRVLGAPIAKAKRVAVVCFNVAANELTQNSSYLWGITHELGYHEGLLTVDQIKHYEVTTRKFPVLPSQTWDRLTEKLYKEFTDTLTTRYGMEIIPVEQVKTAPSYRNLVASPTVYTEEAYSTSYKGLKKYGGNSVKNWLTNATVTMGNLITELDVDALLIVTVNLTMTWDFAFSPALHIEMIGAPMGYEDFMTTQYVKGAVLVHNRRKLSIKEVSSAGSDVLDTAIDTTDKFLFASFSDALGKVKVEEEKSEYYKITLEK